MKKANAEAWAAMRRDAESKSTAQAQQKTADIASDNATLAQNIKRDILLLIQRTLSEYPADASEIKKKVNGEQHTYRLKDLADAYKTMTSDMIPQADESELRRIKEILGSVESVIE